MPHSGNFSHRLRNHWSRFILWEARNARTVLLWAAVLVALMFWQGSKLYSRLRGGLVSMPGSESEQVLHTVEAEFSKAIAYPTILIQETLGPPDVLEKNWQLALKAVRENIPDVKDVIDMHLGRQIVADLTVNTTSFHHAQETISQMRRVGLPEDFEITDLKVNRDGRILATVQTDVRSFKEGEARKKAMDENMGKMNLPEGSTLKMQVTRHPRRNFAMVEADVQSYQEAETLTASLQKTLHDLNLPPGDRVRVTGLPALFYDLNNEATSTLKKAEMIGIPVCFLLLIWVFGSATAAALPITVAFVALVMGTAVMTKVGKFMEISMFVPSVLSMIGLGVGVDYMLILLSRFRECIGRHSNVDEAIVESVNLAAPTLLGSAFTVMIGFLALVFTPIGIFRAMGIAGIVVILCALISIFLLAPPLFKISRPYLSWNGPIEVRTPFWKKWTHLLVEHPLICLIIGISLMLALAYPALDIKTASLNPDSLPEHLESRRGYNLGKNGFGAGWLMPALILIEKSNQQSEEEYLEKEKSFITNLRKMGATFDTIGASDLAAGKQDGFQIEIPSTFFLSKSGRYHLILAMFDGNPMSWEGRAWVQKIRELSRTAWKTDEGYICRTGGVVASTLDVDEAVKIYMVRTAIFCLTTTFLCLAFLYRSILIPLEAILMNLLSVCGAYGFLVLWYQKGVGTAVMPSLVPSGQGMNSIVILLLFCALFGLSMDYQVFLISRIREEWRRSHNNKLAVRHGIELTGKVVTGAAAVMISIFLSFAFISVLETRQFGTGMAVAIAADATIIRLLVFPSLMLLVGNANWWWPFKKGKDHHDPTHRPPSQIRPPSVLRPPFHRTHEIQPTDHKG